MCVRAFWGGGRGTEASHVRRRIVLYCYWWRVLHIILYTCILYAQHNRFYFSAATEYIYNMYTYIYVYYIIVKYIIIFSGRVFFFFKTKTKKLFNPPAFIYKSPHIRDVAGGCSRPANRCIIIIRRYNTRYRS